MNLEPSIDRRHDALLCIDVQYDFLPGGALAVDEGLDILAGIALYAAKFDTIVATQDWHPDGHVSFCTTHGVPPFTMVGINGHPHTAWPVHCVQGSPGARIHPAVPLNRTSMILRKGTRLDTDSYSAFEENVGPDGKRAPTGLFSWLVERGVKRVFMVGLARDVCVAASAIDLASRACAQCAQVGSSSPLITSHVVWPLTRSVKPEDDVQLRMTLKLAGVEVVE